MSVPFQRNELLFLKQQCVNNKVFFLKIIEHTTSFHEFLLDFIVEIKTWSCECCFFRLKIVVEKYYKKMGTPKHHQTKAKLHMMEVY